MTDSLTGGCLCGGVRFDARRAAAGGRLLPLHALPAPHRDGVVGAARASTATAFDITAGAEHVRWWRHPDGGFEKGFCASCGAHLFSRNPDDHAQLNVRLGAFDGDPGVRPSFRQFVAYAAPWEPIPDDGLPRYDERRPEAALPGARQAAVDEQRLARDVARLRRAQEGRGRRDLRRRAEPARRHLAGRRGLRRLHASRSPMAMRSVAIRPGSTALNVTPSAAYSRASSFIPASRPGRLTFESCRPASGSRATSEDTASTRPKPRSRMPGTTRCMSSIGDTTSERCAASHSAASGASGSSKRGGPPVLAT